MAGRSERNPDDGLDARETLSSEESYWDRVGRIAQMMDMRNALATNAQIRAALEKTREAAGAAPEGELRRARQLVEATVHPDTGEIVRLPLRLSAIVPVNVALDALMISASASGRPLLIGGAQVANQVYNALHYHANANHTNPQDAATRAAAFSLATLSSTAVALAINSAPHSSAGLLRRLAPFLAVASADLLNVGTIRSTEWIRGIYVYDSSSRARIPEPSRRAGAVAVLQCTLSRVVAAVAPLVGPPLLLAFLDRRYSHLPVFNRLRIPILLASLAVAIQVGVPLTFAIFKQNGQLPASWLESNVQDLAPSGRVMYNKGL